MFRIQFIFVILLVRQGASAVSSQHNETLMLDEEIPANLTASSGSLLWTMLLKDCKKPTISCVKNNIYNYLKDTFNYKSDVQFTSFMKFAKNTVDYNKLDRSFDISLNDTAQFYQDMTPLEEISRSLHDNSVKFLMTHDMELKLPDTFFEGTMLRMSPRSLEDNGALIKLEFIPRNLNTSVGDDRTFKKIKKFISEKLIYALMAILMIIKMIAAKFLFILPAILGAAAAKKILIKTLLFIFPALHKLFSFCAYVPHGTKFHHHKHQISHVHHVGGHGHKPHGHYEVLAPHSAGPPSLHHGYPDHEGPHKPLYNPGEHDFEYYQDGAGLTNDLISHRNDPERGNEIEAWGQGRPIRREPPIKRPLTPTEIENMILKAEKEALIKTRLHQERQKIHEENLRLQDQLNNALKLQEKLKQHSAAIGGNGYSNPYGTHGLYKPSQILRSPLRPSVAPPPEPLPSQHLAAHHYASQYIPPQHLSSQLLSAQHLPAQHSSIHHPPTQHLPTQQVPPKHVPVQQLPITQLTNSVISYAQQTPYHINNDQQQFNNVQHPVNQIYNVQSKVSHVQPQPQITPVFKSTQAPVEVQQAPVTESTFAEEMHKAASITYDAFYSPILEKIDIILIGLSVNDEPCRERLICSMYKNPTKFSPHSNLLSAELSRDASELEKPTATNAAVIRFYRYVQAARDGQDNRDCLKLYASCSLVTE